MVILCFNDTDLMASCTKYEVRQLLGNETFNRSYMLAYREPSHILNSFFFIIINLMLINSQL
jgi:hypothetical protein